LFQEDVGFEKRLAEGPVVPHEASRKVERRRVSRRRAKTSERASCLRLQVPRDRLATLAHGFPALAALVSIYGLFSDPGSIAKHLDEISGFVPAGAVEVAREQLTRVATKGERTLGLTSAVGLAISSS
jgi:hypothetical protein